MNSALKAKIQYVILAKKADCDTFGYANAGSGFMEISSHRYIAPKNALISIKKPAAKKDDIIRIVKEPWLLFVSGVGKSSVRLTIARVLIKNTVLKIVTLNQEIPRNESARFVVNDLKHQSKETKNIVLQDVEILHTAKTRGLYRIFGAAGKQKSQI